MNILFEDDGQVRAGAILSESDASAQVELPGGRRVKVKSNHVLLRFDAPDAAAMMSEAQKHRADIDMMLLWQAAEGREECAFTDLAVEYFGRDASSAQQAAILLALHQAPMYFYKRGRGRYKRAPEEALQAALASVERKAREAAQMEQWVNTLVAGDAPPEIRAKWASLLHAPDRQSLEYKALAAAADRARMAPVHLLARAGAIPSTHALHYERFRLATFPRGTAFPAGLEVPVIPAFPQAEVAAFSIDDESTTEIDDAFSLRPLADGGFVLGIHIAAPAVAIGIDTPLDRVARDRLSTVYLPSSKITMLPDDVVAAFSLDAGKTPPALTLYVTLDADLGIVGTETRIECVPIASNLRLAALDDLRWLDPAHDATSAGGHAPTLRVLHALATRLAAARAAEVFERTDYSFKVTGDADREDCRIDIWPRLRGSPVDTVVSELAILANRTWAALLAEQAWPAMYRVQIAGKTRMSSAPGAHEGLNVPAYVWATSPLRRFSDLVNQRQLLALIEHRGAAYPRGDTVLLGALADFDTTYSAYADFQQQMEFYWCLRYLRQEGIEQLTARVIRDNLVRFTTLPIIQRIHDLAPQAPGTEVRLAITDVDLFEPALHVRCLEVAAAAPP